METATKDTVIGELLNYLAEVAPEAGDIDPALDLFDSKALDSFHILTMVTFIESRFDVVLDHDDLNEDNFRTLEAIATLVGFKAGASH
jgi:acyl carrier protein